MAAQAPFETAEQRQLYKFAVNFSGVVEVAAEALALLDEVKRFIGNGGQVRLEGLQGRLNELCSFED